MSLAAIPLASRVKTVLPERIALVLGGGGLKGFAHIGLLRALQERGIRPALVAGTSIGALIAAAFASGMPVAEMERRALALTKKDLFRIDRLHILTKRMLSPSLYLAGPLDALVRDIVPDRTFRSLEIPLLVNTVDLERGAQVIWGLPGLQDVSVADAVYASCALPGFFPPRVIDGRTCVDGGVMDNLPNAIAVQGMDAVIGVDVGSSSLATARRIKDKGFAAIYMRAATTMMKSLQVSQLATWAGPPLLLVRPPVWHYHWFSFVHTRRMIDAGYTAAHDALDRAGDALSSTGGVYPRRTIELSVRREKCIGCTLCVTLAPDLMAMDAENKAIVLESPLEWSRADGDFIHQCPTDAIRVEVVEGEVRRSTMEREVEAD
jgi:NTE family protein